MVGVKYYYLLRPYLPRTLQIQVRRLWFKCWHRYYRDVWPIDKQAGKQPPAWPGWPEGKQFGLVLTHDVDTRAGFDRCRQLAEMELELGFRSSFNFVPERYPMDSSVRRFLEERGFEIGVHGLYHDGKLFSSRQTFETRARRINAYLNDWNAVGFRAPSMHHKLEWIHRLNIEYDLSTFDTDPFEPQSDGVATIFPFWVGTPGAGNGYLEMPYTLPQDFTIFILMREQNIDLWLNKLDWVASRGGLALVNVHPDYLTFLNGGRSMEAYPAAFYHDFLKAVQTRYENLYWHGLPRDLACYYLASGSACP